MDNGDSSANAGALTPLTSPISEDAAMAKRAIKLFKLTAADGFKVRLAEADKAVEASAKAFRRVYDKFEKDVIEHARATIVAGSELGNASAALSVLFKMKLTPAKLLARVRIYAGESKGHWNSGTPDFYDEIFGARDSVMTEVQYHSRIHTRLRGQEDSSIDYAEDEDGNKMEVTDGVYKRVTLTVTLKQAALDARVAHARWNAAWQARDEMREREKRLPDEVDRLKAIVLREQLGADPAGARILRLVDASARSMVDGKKIDHLI